MKAVAEHHAHVCEDCANIWWHYWELTTGEENRKRHMCPKCGAGPYRTAFPTQRDALEVRKMLRDIDTLQLPEAVQP